MAISPDIHILGQGIESWKLWSFLITSFATVVIGGYRGFQWIKGIRTEDFTEVKESLSKVATKIEETSAAQLRSTEFQTQSLVRELSELRGLFHGAFYQGIPQAKMAPVRKKAAPRKKKPSTTQLALDNES